MDKNNNIIYIIPYVISSKGILDKIGMVRKIIVNHENPEDYTLSGDYSLLSVEPTTDDGTLTVAANRRIFEITNKNIESANLWTYLGELKISNSLYNRIILYAVNVSGIIEDSSIKKNDSLFNLVNTSEMVHSDDAILLSAYLRLFRYLYSSVI